MRLPISLLTLLIFFAPVPASAGPEGQMTWGLHFSPTPGWFDPFKLAELLPHSTLCTRCTTP
jgi:hypothetical protein